MIRHLRACCWCSVALLLLVASPTTAQQSPRAGQFTVSNRPSDGPHSAANNAANKHAGPANKPKPVSNEGLAKEGLAKDVRRPLAGITPEREAAVMTFVKRNHEELAGLLDSLKSSSPRDYKRAVLDLHRTSERLAHIQERQPERYDLEVQLWKCESRLQLLAARLSMSDREELREQLRATLEEQLEVRKQILQLERERAAQRLAKLDEHIEKIERDRERYITQQVKRLTRSPRSSPSRSMQKPREEPAAAPSPRSTPAKSSPAAGSTTNR